MRWRDERLHERMFFDGAPDIIGTVRGYRIFRMGAAGQLISPYRDQYWGGGVQVSRCLADHRAPWPGCTCGFYSYYAPGSCAPARGNVCAVIENSGAIELNAKGMRSEKARIVALCAGGRKRRELLAAQYPGVPVYRTRRRMHRVFPPAREVCGVPAHAVRAHYRPVRALAFVMNAFMWANFGAHGPHWTSAIIPLVTTFVLVPIAFIISG